MRRTKPTTRRAIVSFADPEHTDDTADDEQQAEEVELADVFAEAATLVWVKVEEEE